MRKLIVILFHFVPDYHWTLIPSILIKMIKGLSFLSKTLVLIGRLCLQLKSYLDLLNNTLLMLQMLSTAKWLQRTFLGKGIQ